MNVKVLFPFSHKVCKQLVLLLCSNYWPLSALSTLSTLLVSIGVSRALENRTVAIANLPVEL